MRKLLWWRGSNYDSILLSTKYCGQQRDEAAASMCVLFLA
jgi:hypothetical protein